VGRLPWRNVVTFAAAAAPLVLLIVHPAFALAQATGSVSAATGCGSMQAGFAGMAANMNGLQAFFYGPVFKIGMGVMFVAAAIGLLADNGDMSGVAKFILRAVLVISAVLALASWLTAPTTGAC
jgi:hypothetical protein